VLKSSPAIESFQNDVSIAVAAKTRKSYPVSIAVRPDSVFVPRDAELEPGTKLEACYAGKWNPLTFLSANSDGSPNVRWDDYGPSFDCSMVRNELIMKKSALRKLTSPAEQTSELRTFADATGKFSVKAKVVRITESQVTLLTDAGKAVTLPLSKLSQADQEFLRSQAEEKDRLKASSARSP
jgi:hypothetical protein